jgi:hypothetical protein
MPVILAIWETEIERITVGRQPKQKVHRTAWAKKFTRPHLNRKNLGMVAGTCHRSYSGKPKIGVSQSWLAWAKEETLSPKITRAKGAGGMAPGIEHLPHRHEALSLNRTG